MSQNVETQLTALLSATSSISAELKAQAEQAKKHGLEREEDKVKVDKLLAQAGTLQAQIEEANQRLAELEGNGAGGDVQHLSLGAQFVQSESFKALQSSPTMRGTAEFTLQNAITTIKDTNDGSAGALIKDTRLPGILALPQRRFTIRDLVASGQMDGHTLEYIKETGFTNNADMVAEGAAKPESSIKFGMETTTAKVIAHWMKASRQVLSDAPMLQSIIDQRLRYGLDFKEEDQLLNGDGTGQNLHGLIPQATPYASPIAGLPNETMIDRLRLALLQAELAEYPSSGIVLNTADWAAIELLKDSLGRYIIGNPQGTLAATLWNLPVVTTQAMTKGKFLAGAFKQGAQIFDRWQTRVEVATEHDKDFTSNMVTILGEKRVAFAVYRPEAFVYGDHAPLVAPGGDIGG